MQEVCFGSLSVVADEEDDRGRGMVWGIVCAEGGMMERLDSVYVKKIGPMSDAMAGLDESRFDSRSLLLVG